MSTNTSDAEAKENMYEDFYVKAKAGDIPAFQRMQNLPTMAHLLKIPNHSPHHFPPHPTPHFHLTYNRRERFN